MEFHVHAFGQFAFDQLILAHNNQGLCTMPSLAGQHILLGVTGGIAAYKSAYLVRVLRENGAQVRVVMTAAAHAFISPLTMQALSGNPVREALLDPHAEAGMDHIELARWADRVLVAPASADFLARLAHGLADDLLATLCLATESPLILCPAMNRVMWQNPATCANVDILISRGVTLLGPDTGSQACGEEGPGRMLEPQRIADALLNGPAGPLRGKHILITAGPTREALDPVRYISNRSSGRMGYALAAAMQKMGARVTLVSGPVGLQTPPGVERIDVESALDMAEAVMRQCADCDLFVAAAAVADYRAEQPSGHKIKKHADVLDLRLVRNPDILSQVASLQDGPFTVGFAAETDRVEQYALEKLRSKGLDMIAANRVGGPRGGFEREENALTVLWSGGRRELDFMPKQKLALHLADIIVERYHAKHPA